MEQIGFSLYRVEKHFIWDEAKQFFSLSLSLWSTFKPYRFQTNGSAVSMNFFPKQNGLFILVIYFTAFLDESALKRFLVTKFLLKANQNGSKQQYTKKDRQNIHDTRPKCLNRLFFNLIWISGHYFYLERFVEFRYLCTRNGKAPQCPLKCKVEINDEGMLITLIISFE